MSRTARIDLIREFGSENVKIAEMMKAGNPMENRSLRDILLHKQPTSRAEQKSLGDLVNDTKLTERQLKKHGYLGQAAILLRKAAISDPSIDVRKEARELANKAEELSNHVQLSFNLIGGKNAMIGHEYYDAVMAELKGKPLWRNAFVLWMEIAHNIPWEDYVCSLNAAELGDKLEMSESQVSQGLKLLEQVGAIKRIKRGRTKAITITPEGVYRGQVTDHQSVVKRYKAEVYDLFNQPNS